MTLANSQIERLAWLRFHLMRTNMMLCINWNACPYAERQAAICMFSAWCGVHAVELKVRLTTCRFLALIDCSLERAKPSVKMTSQP